MNHRLSVAIGLLAATAMPALLPAQDDTFTIPAGSTLRVRLKTTITSKTNKTGDTFTAQVFEPIVVDGKDVVPAGSTVEGHVAFVKPAGRVKGKAEMRIIVDAVRNWDAEINFPISASLENSSAGECAKVSSDKEGTIEGCGKSKKSAVKDAAIAGAVGAGIGATVGIAGRGGCDYYGNCWPGSGPGIGTSIMYGAGIGAGAGLIYNLLKHEKEIVLPQGTELTFVVNRTIQGVKMPPADKESGQDKPN